MLRIIVELVPGGIGRPRELARAMLGNLSMLDKISDYSVMVREGPNPIADTPAWEADGTITGHDREQTVWTLVHAAALFALTQAPKSDVRLVAGPEAFPKSAVDRIREIAEAGGRVALRTTDLTDKEVEAIMKPHRGCARCDAVLNDGWSFCPFCGERLLIS